jgi:hypothetical protein
MKTPREGRGITLACPSSVEAIILAGDVDAGDVIVLPDARDAVLRQGMGRSRWSQVQQYELTTAVADDKRQQTSTDGRFQVRYAAALAGRLTARSRRPSVTGGQADGGRTDHAA